MCFHHLDGFFNIAIFVSLKNSQMFLIDPSLDHGFPAVLVGKNRNPASEPFGGLCKSGVVAVTVKNEMEFVGIPVPGLHISGFGSCTYKLQGTPRLLDFLYSAGLGSRRSEGHGKWEIVW